MKKLLAFLVVVLIAAAFAAGYWPERQRRVIVEGDLAGVRAQLELAESRLRLAALLGDLIALSDAVADRNYGQAQDQSSRFFDAVRGELSRTTHADQKDALEWILRSRDAVTVALTRSDPAAGDLLRRIQLRLRMLLGYPAAPPASAPELPASPSPSPAAAVSPSPAAASPAANPRVTTPPATPPPAGDVQPGSPSPSPSVEVE